METEYGEQDFQCDRRRAWQRCCLQQPPHPIAALEVDIEIPLWKFGLSDHEPLRAEDLMRGSAFVWTGKHQRVRLDPELPFAIWRVA